MTMTAPARRHRAPRRRAGGAAWRRLRAFARQRRGAAGIELALGTVALLSIATAGFDLYVRIDAGTAAMRMAAAMADYVSGETAPDGAQMDALGEYLRDAELKRSADVVFVVKAIRQAAGDPLPAATVEWADTIRFGDADVTTALLATPWCDRFGAAGAAATLPDEFTGGAGNTGAATLASGDLLVAVEVCARLDAEGALSQRLLDGGIYEGGIYGLYALPARAPHAGPAQPARPAAPSGGGGGNTPGGGGEASGGGGNTAGGGNAPGNTAGGGGSVSGGGPGAGA